MDKHAELSWYSDVKQPGSNPYHGDIYVLTDRGCFSACEGFWSRSKIIIAPRSSVQDRREVRVRPTYQDLGDGMGVAVNTKREYFPDGATFEGVGVAPDVEVLTTIEDLRAGRDPVMAKVHELIRAKQKP